MQMMKQGLVMLLLTTVSQILQFGSMVLLARWYSPAQIGILSQLTALLLFFVPWGALCIPYAFVLSQTVAERYKLLVLCRLLSSFLAVTFVALYAVLSVNEHFIASPLWLLLLAVALYASAMQSVYQQWFFSFQQFVLPAYLAFAGTLVLVIGRVGIGIAGRGYQELIFLTLMSSIVAMILFRYYWRKSIVVSRFTYPDFIELFRKYRQFPLYQAPQQALNAVSQQAPILLFALWYNDELTGHYALALSCLAAPVALLSKSLGDWLYPQFAYCTADRFRSLLVRSTSALAVAGLLPMIVLMTAHQEIFSWVFGMQWSQAGVIASILAPWFFMVALNTPALKAIMVMQAQKYTLLLNVGTTILRVGGLSAVYVFGADVMLAIWWLSLCGVVHNMLVIAGAFVIERRRTSGNFQVAL